MNSHQLAADTAGQVGRRSDAFVPTSSNWDAEKCAWQVRADSAGNSGAPIDHDDERATGALASTNTQRRRVRFRMLGQAIPSARHNVTQRNRLDYLTVADANVTSRAQSLRFPCMPGTFVAAPDP